MCTQYPLADKPRSPRTFRHTANAPQHQPLREKCVCVYVCEKKEHICFSYRVCTIGPAQ